MRLRGVLLGITLSLSCLVLITSVVAQDARKQVTAFVNVNVIPMDRERVLENQTVIVRDGHIAEIGPADKVKVPGGAQGVDGRGKYLLPGLADLKKRSGVMARGRWMPEGELQKMLEEVAAAAQAQKPKS